MYYNVCICVNECMYSKTEKQQKVDSKGKYQVDDD